MVSYKYLGTLVDTHTDCDVYHFGYRGKPSCTPSLRIGIAQSIKRMVNDIS